RRCAGRRPDRRHRRVGLRPLARRAARANRHSARIHSDPAPAADRPVRSRAMTRPALFALGVAALAAYPLMLGSNAAINTGFLILFAAYLGQAWNIAGGFAGQTSFGHVVFFGVGAYVSTILQT